MAIPVAQKLIESAQSGQKLTAKERRHAVAFLMSTDQSSTNTSLADLFQVTERTIRLDKKSIREEKSQLIKEEDVGLVIADILLDYERAIREIEKSAKDSKSGSQVRLNHINSKMDMRLKTVKALQDLGWLPKNLGNMTMDKFEYRAVVHKDGNVEVRKVDMFDALVGEAPKLTKGDATRAALDAEYCEAEVVNEQSKTGQLRENIQSDAAGREEAASITGASEAASQTI